MLFPLLSRLARRAPHLLLLLALLSAAPSLRASHLRAGDIQAKIDTSAVNPNPRRVFFKMVLYQRIPGGSVPDETQVTIFFGDGTRQVVSRTGGPVQVTPVTNRNVYLFEHTYNAASPGQGYVVSYVGENRNAGVVNMTGSDQQTFYISTTITINPGLGRNRTPVLTNAPIDNATIAQVFSHNPGAYDADGDSLAYKITPSKQIQGGLDAVMGNRPVPVTTTGWRLPSDLLGGNNGQQVPFSGPPVGVPGSPSIFVQNEFDGQITWNSPGTLGEYNVAFVVEEWRRTRLSNGRITRNKIGEVLRDMQITVLPTNNRPPVLTIPPDLCVVAGTPVTAQVSATDPDGHQIRLSAASGILPPATFTQNLLGPPTATGTFRWTPSCSDIAELPRVVVFKAEDQPPGSNVVRLADLRSWRITVIGPPPQNLQANRVPNTSNVVLTWNPYFCSNADSIIVFRKENPSTWTPGACETGIPASAGYTRIGAVTGGITSFQDTRGGLGLERGKTYCYRIFARFPLPAGGRSIASQEACITFPGRAAVFTNVTVDRTATNGQITVRWTKPGPTDTFNPPLVYRLLRAPGQSATPTPDFAEIARIVNRPNDTTYVDNGVDTQNRAYIYKLEFIRNSTNQPGSATTTETATPASSVRLSGTANPADNSIVLSWTYNVPWDNSVRPTLLFRRDGTTGAFTQIASLTGTRTGGSYTDRGTPAQPLVKGRTYCYYVQTNGTYANPAIVEPLVNLSQQLCVPLRAVPCPPVLTLKRTNCDSLGQRLFQLPSTPVSGPVFTNYLKWTLGNTPPDCSRAIAAFNIYYSPNSQDSVRFLASVPGTQFNFEHRNLSAEGGCYAVQAVDSAGLRSAFSNRECKDDCVLFLMPNVFTPNGDGKNDVLRPKVFTPVRRTVFRVFNRWGTKIYESDKEPLIKWDGGNTSREGASNSTVVDGVYYYQAEVEFADQNNTKRTFKGWVEIVR